MLVTIGLFTMPIPVGLKALLAAINVVAFFLTDAVEPRGFDVPPFRYNRVYAHLQNFYLEPGQR